MVSTVDKDIVLQVDIRSVEGEVVAVRRVSRIQKEDELLQKAMRKKSRKVGGAFPVITKLRVDFRLQLYIHYCLCVCVVQVSRQGDWLVFTEKVGVLTTQAGTQQVQERRVRVGSDDLEKLVDLGY